MCDWYNFLKQENSTNAPLVEATLETFLKFLNWIPVGYMFETNIISLLVEKVSYDFVFNFLQKYHLMTFPHWGHPVILVYEQKELRIGNYW